MPVFLMPFKNNKSNALLIEYDLKAIQNFRAYNLRNNRLFPLNLQKYQKAGFLHIKETGEDVGFKIIIINPEKFLVTFQEKAIIDSKLTESIIELDKNKGLIRETKEECLKDLFKDYFLKEHKAQLEKDNRSFFSLFSCWRSTKVKDTWTFDQIIHHAKTNNNRSRKVLINMGFMNNNGEPTGLLKDINFLSNNEEQTCCNKFD